MQAARKAGAHFSATLSSPLGNIRLGSRAGCLFALDFADDAETARKIAAKPSAGLLDGKQISTLRLAGKGEQEDLPIQNSGQAEQQGCQLLENSLSADAPQEDVALLQKTADELDRYFRGELTVFSVPLALEGTEFQRRIWQALLEIPLGSSLSYGELAEKAGYSASSYGRAAGTAVGSNPVSIIVPCHRIVGKDGKMTGYSGGLWRKLRLLSLEGFKIAT